MFEDLLLTQQINDLSWEAEELIDTNQQQL
jgi:hypothetical protein